jgi:hypothetical protein
LAREKAKKAKMNVLDCILESPTAKRLFTQNPNTANATALYQEILRYETGLQIVSPPIKQAQHILPTPILSTRNISMKRLSATSRYVELFRFPATYFAPAAA